MTIEQIKAANTRPSFTNTDIAHRGTIEAFLWLASKACITREVKLVNAAIAKMVELDANGTFTLQCTPEQGEHVRFVSDHLKAFGDGTVSARKERVALQGTALAISELRAKVARNAEYDF